MQVRLGPDCPAELSKDIERVLSLGRESTTNLRGLLSALRRPDADDETVSGWTLESLPGVLAQRVADLRERGFAVSTGVEGDPGLLSPSLRSCLAKVIVEAITNMAKHATPGAHCTIMIGMGTEGFEAMFSNPYSGKTGPTGMGGLGLIGAAERVQALGGQLRTRAGDGQWTLTITVPTDPESGHGHG